MSYKSIINEKRRINFVVIFLKVNQYFKYFKYFIIDFKFKYIIKVNKKNYI
jgi:hypothetical protein